MQDANDLQTGTGSPKPAVNDRLIGRRVAGYRIEGMLGRGGMGVVYRAVDDRLGRSVALKVMAPDQAAEAGFRRRFIHESRLAAAIDHPNILPVYEAGEDRGVLFMVTRLVNGSDLRELLGQAGRLAPARALEVVAQIAAALDAAHTRGLVHRDVKPANVLIATGSGPGGVEHCYLTDFGLAKLASGGSGLTAAGQFVGTLDYIAPEQLRGEQVDARADVYALGALLFQCLVGAPPFERDTGAALMWAHLHDSPPPVSERLGALPGQLDEVIARAMAKTPSERFSSCMDIPEAVRSALADGVGSSFRAQLPEVLADGAAPTVPTTVLDAAASDGGPRRARGPRVYGISIGVVACAVLIGAVGWTLLGPGENEPVQRLAVGDASWSTSTGGSIVSTPAVAGGNLVVGSDDRSVHAFDVNSGRRRWRTSTDGAVRSSPSVSEGTVYVGSFDGSVYALQGSNGRVLWRTPTGFEVFSSPALSGGNVVVGTDGILALDAESGRRRWRLETGAPVNSSPTIADGIVYAGSDDGGLHAVELDSGERRWKLELGRRVNSSPTVAGGTVFVGSSEGLHAVDARSGRQRWRFATEQGINSSPTVVAGTVFVGSRDRHVYAVDADSGEQRWRFTAGDRVDSSPTVESGVVYVGANDGAVYGLDAGSGKPRWRFTTSAPVVASPTVSRGTVFVATDDGAVHAVRGAR